jgi:hypothetical protein
MVALYLWWKLERSQGFIWLVTRVFAGRLINRTWNNRTSVDIEHYCRRQDSSCAAEKVAQLVPGLRGLKVEPADVHA